MVIERGNDSNQKEVITTPYIHYILSLIISFTTFATNYMVF